MDQRVEQFRKIRQQMRRGRRSGAAPYPAEAKAIALELAAERGLEAEDNVELARELGLAPQTLEVWGSRDNGAEIRPVTLAPSTPPSQQGPSGASGSEQRHAAAAPGAPGELVVQLPGGIRVEGLDLETVVMLVRRLS